MFNNRLYVHGDQNVHVPAHLSFGKYMLERLKPASKSNQVAMENALTGDKLTYKDFAEYAVNLAASLTRLGVNNKHIVGIGSEKRVQFIPTALAVVFTGAAYTPYDLQSGRAVLQHKLNLTRPKYLICSQLFWKTYGDILKTLDFIEHFICLDESPDIEISIKSLIMNQVDVATFEPAAVRGQTDTALILYSSGTTGMPKGVQLTHLNCILNSLPKDFEDESLKTMFLFGEWYHNYDTFMTYKFLSLGRRIIYIDHVTPENVLKSIQTCQVNITMLVPLLVGYLSKAEKVVQYDLSTLKVIYCRSSPLHGKTIEAIKKRFPTLRNLLQGYGMTESGELTSESWGTKGPKVGSVGMASPGITLKIVDPETREIRGPNQRGEICLRGPVFMKGYIEIEPSTYLDDQGFFLTGDLGYYDDDKYFYIVDRLKEIMSYDGNKVAPLELETILLLHAGVREAGVVGKPAGDVGEEPTAFVVRQPGASVTEQELIDYVSAETTLLLRGKVCEATAMGRPAVDVGAEPTTFVVREPGARVTEQVLSSSTTYVSAEVPPYMQLRGGVKFVPELPRNPRGKILRRRLREMLNEDE